MNSMASIPWHYVVNCCICILLSSYVVVKGQESINKLPHCVENVNRELVLVSTLDGKISALDKNGVISWQIETGPGPLLTSNIHQLELTNNGQWIRIIPSLSGGLYKFDGSYIDAIPITAESLLKSSFRYSDDLVIAGGLEVRTYGVTLHTGVSLYECSALNCKNMTDSIDSSEDIAVIERSTRTVRAIEPRTGIERWNFSVGQHNIKLPHVSCLSSNIKFNFNVSAVMPDGILSATYNENAENNWQYKFESPIVNVWKWNGQEIELIDLFSTHTKGEIIPSTAKGIYLAMHNKQLYIHESIDMLNAVEVEQHSTNKGIVESQSLAKIPWKPVVASSSASDTVLVPSEVDSTALSILYASEYVNGNGYYLYPEVEKANSICDTNGTVELLPGNPDEFDYVINSIWYWWKEIIVISITTAVVFNVMCKSFTRNKQPNEKIIYVEKPVPIPLYSKNDSSGYKSSEGDFQSRFTDDFETISCLGKGGFGIVFHVKKKIDECDYAIKRITLPKEENSRERVMREVKALAKLEHHNIVRYFNSWVECPPHGWQLQHDIKYVPDTSSFFGTKSVVTTTQHKRSHSVGIDVSHCEEILEYEKYQNTTKASSASFVVFQNTNNGQCSTDQTTSFVLSTTTGDETSEHERKKINWKRPDRRSHSLNMISKGGVVQQESTPMFLYIQMELCRKESLKDWLAENKQRDPIAILHMFKQIVCAVECVHLMGLIHRDLKPSNIFFSLEGQIKIGDFGLVTHMSESEINEANITHSPRGHTKAVGTRLYMSPEQCSNQQYNYKVDIFSLGLIFFELLVPFNTEMERISTLLNVKDKNYPPEFLSKYNNEHELLNIMLSDDPKKRPTTIGIKARPPLQQLCPDICTKTDHHFELPPLIKKFS